MKKYNQIRNKVRSESRRIQASEQAAIAISCKNNPKKIWKYVRSKTNYVSNIGDLKYIDCMGEKIIAKEDDDKANALVEYFSSVFTTEGSDPIAYIKPQLGKQPMEDLVISEANIKLKLKNLKLDKSPGLHCGP
jgi:hypothetical protein